MLLSSSHWFRVTGSGTFQLLMMVVALFAVQSSMAYPISTSAFRSSIHEYQEKQANQSALTLSGSLANSSTPSTNAPACKHNYCGNCGPHSVCVNKDNVTCDCECEVGYVQTGFPSNCTLFCCVVYDNVNEPMDSCIWNNSYCIAREQLCVCKPGFEPRPSGVDFECQPIPGWTTTSTTTSSTVSTSPSTTTSTELPSTTTTTSSWFSKNIMLIVGILVVVLMVALILLYVFGCHCCRKEAKIGDTSGANYRRQAYQPSPNNSKDISNVSSKASSKAASNATSKATSKINSAKATSKH